MLTKDDAILVASNIVKERWHVSITPSNVSKSRTRPNTWVIMFLQHDILNAKGLGEHIASVDGAVFVEVNERTGEAKVTSI